ncbi:DUF309 domain-containing protein [Paenibacillus sp. NEAU-GSW1]|nr:DUF309 domain-containing protein [Paenibacillus sp. NEAU-GSW1]
MERYPNAYFRYLLEYHATRDFFECHELLEEYWKEHPDDPRSELWVGLIQLAVGHYHLRRGNSAGARKIYANALKRLNPSGLASLGLDGAMLLAKLQNRQERLIANKAVEYEELDLKIVDPEVETECRRLCGEYGLVWGVSSTDIAESVIHRHKLRDRSDVIAARAAAAELKKRSRPGAV